MKLTYAKITSKVSELYVYDHTSSSRVGTLLRVECYILY